MRIDRENLENGLIQGDMVCQKKLRQNYPQLMAETLTATPGCILDQNLSIQIGKAFNSTSLKTIPQIRSCLAQRPQAMVKIM